MIYIIIAIVLALYLYSKYTTAQSANSVFEISNKWMEDEFFLEKSARFNEQKEIFSEINKLNKSRNEGLINQEEFDNKLYLLSLQNALIESKYPHGFSDDELKQFISDSSYVNLHGNPFD